MKYTVHTFGCRVNQADSFEIEEALRYAGGAPAAADEADLVVVNTCSVTGAADRDARSLIRRIAARNPAARVVVTGCYATRAPEELESLPGVARVVTNARKDGLLRIVRECAATEAAGDGVAGAESLADSSAVARGGCEHAGPLHIQPGVMGRTAFPLRVQTGCDEACAYCIVPSTRGPSRSRPPADVAAAASRLAAAGYKELWVVGVHLGAYGRDLPGLPTLVGLLRALDRLPGDLTFRLGSIEPMDCPRDLVDLVVRSGRFAPHFHLPLQHTNDRVLGAMRRPYTCDGFRSLVGAIREALPHSAIGTDLLTGFPGESESDADECAESVAALPLTHVHVFPYSERPGTAAAGMTPKVPPAVITRRARRLREIGAELFGRFARAHADTIRPGLTLDDGTTVLTDTFVKVTIPPGLPRNVRVKVRIETASPVPTGRVV